MPESDRRWWEIYRGGADPADVLLDGYMTVDADSDTPRVVAAILELSQRVEHHLASVGRSTYISEYSTHISSTHPGCAV
jgi:hypothetical protein